MQALIPPLSALLPARTKDNQKLPVAMFDVVIQVSDPEGTIECKEHTGWPCQRCGGNGGAESVGISK